VVDAVESTAHEKAETRQKGRRGPEPSSPNAVSLHPPFLPVVVALARGKLLFSTVVESHPAHHVDGAAEKPWHCDVEFTVFTPAIPQQRVYDSIIINP